MIYLLYVAYNKKIKKENESLYLEIALYTSIYLIIKYDSFHRQEVSTLLLLNIPLLVSYLKNKKITPIIISIINSFYYIVHCQQLPYLVVIEYALYYLIYVIIIKRKIKIDTLINIFILIKTFIISLEVFYIIKPFDLFFHNFIYVFVNSVVLYCISYLVLFLLQKGEEIIDLNNTLLELEKEKSLRASLFKITHEIKNPIAVCKGYLDMMDTNNKEKMDKYIPIIKGEINRTLTLMDDYLDYTKIKVEKDIIDIYYLIEDTLDSLNGLLKKNDVIGDFKIPNKELYINADYNRLKQVLVNVFKNAIEAKKEDSDLKISLRTKIDNDNLLIIISDNGIGMDDETLKRVSEMFFTTKKNGTGLGIALSKEIVELHGGTINYFSELGKGTKVVITLPINEKNQENPD